MPNDGILPQIANIVCTQCYATYKNRKLTKIYEITYEINFRKLLHQKSVLWKLVSINYLIYSGINSSNIINFLYRFCIPSSNNLSGDQDDVMMVEEENLEAETIAKAILQIEIKIVTMKLQVITANREGL